MYLISLALSLASYWLKSKPMDEGLASEVHPNHRRSYTRARGHGRAELFGIAFGGDCVNR